MTGSSSSRSRVWILACALGCFASGISVGLALPGVVSAFAEGSATPDPDEQYVRRLADDLGLDASQRRVLRIVQQRFASERDGLLRETNVAQLPLELQRALKQARRRLLERMNVVLTDDQRLQFEKIIEAQGSGEVK